MGLSQLQAEALLSAARDAAENAYAPYSHFPVGAALLLEDGAIMTGVNVENVSYGLTICAERTAVVSAVAQGHRQFSAIAVWASRRPHGSVTPCGACRQFLAEFMNAESLVICSDVQTGKLKHFTMANLLPEMFGLTPALSDNYQDRGSSRPDD
jgi:cytidine deaminase